MKVRFEDETCDRLETDPTFTGGFAKPIARAFRKVLNVIRAATDERDIREMKSLRMEKLKGDRAQQMSLRLNDRWRLIIEIEPGQPKNTVVVIGIEDYH
jgi:toxin HigB-1